MAAEPVQRASTHQSFWLWVLCLVGLDYFSTLAYQPSIAFQTAGTAAPLATVVIVLVTFLGALPVYWYVAGRSPHGQGAIGLLERTVHGWLGKLLIVILLGFAATDFVITKTLSVADAALFPRKALVDRGNHEANWQGRAESSCRTCVEPRRGLRYNTNAIGPGA